MRKIILMRHGDYTYEGGESLSSSGRASVRVQARFLEDIVGCDSCAIVSSPAPRAIETAGIVSRMLEGIRVIAKNKVGEHYFKRDMYDVVEGFNTDVLIIVSHQPTIETLSELISAKKGIHMPGSYATLSVADFICFDLEKHKVSLQRA